MNATVQTFRQDLIQGVLDVAYAIRVRLTPERGHTDQVKMCWRVAAVDDSPLLPGGYEIDFWSGPNAPVGWAEALRAAGLMADDTTWHHEFVAHAPVAVCLAVHDHAIAGTAGLRRIGAADSSVGVITFVGVQPEHQGHGIGRALTAALMHAAYAAHLDHVFLATDDQRLPAIRVYLSVGFRPCLNSWDRGHHWRWQRVARALSVQLDYCRNRSHAAALASLND